MSLWLYRFACVFFTQSRLQQLQVRKDRVTAFAYSLPAGTASFTYKVYLHRQRSIPTFIEPLYKALVVTPGEFALPPTKGSLGCYRSVCFMYRKRNFTRFCFFASALAYAQGQPVTTGRFIV